MLNSTLERSPDPAGPPLCLTTEEAARLRAAQPSPAVIGAAAGRAAALGDPTRLALAVILAGARELCVADIAFLSGRAQNLVSHHLRVLRAQGLVRVRRDGKLALYGVTDEGRALLREVLRPTMRV
jgi:DNA-binding transcriptional ArsR family regulator